MIGNVFKAGKEVDTNLEARAVIVSMAQQLGVGQYGSQLCPQCSGGGSKERSLSLNVETNGVIKFYCHRAACGFAGSAYATPGLREHPEQSRVPIASHLNPLNADLYPLSEGELDYFHRRYGISAAAAGSNIRRMPARYAISVLGPSGSVRGWITRRPYSDSPADTPANRADSQYATKCLTYMEKDEPALAWYGSGLEDIYLVEDQLSAMRLVEYFRTGDPHTSARVVALLGTGINAEKVAEVQRNSGTSRVYIALDKDATGAAFSMARKWRNAFAECRVVILDKDIKDSTDEEISRLPLY